MQNKTSSAEVRESSATVIIMQALCRIIFLRRTYPENFNDDVCESGTFFVVKMIKMAHRTCN